MITHLGRRVQKTQLFHNSDSKKGVKGTYNLHMYNKKQDVVICKQAVITNSYKVLPDMLYSNVFSTGGPQPILACERLSLSYSIMLPSPVTNPSHRAWNVPVRFLSVSQLSQIFVTPDPPSSKHTAAIKFKIIIEEEKQILAVTRKTCSLCFHRKTENTHVALK